jgi:hypothetical protein
MIESVQGNRDVTRDSTQPAEKLGRAPPDSCQGHAVDARHHPADVAPAVAVGDVCVGAAVQRRNRPRKGRGRREFGVPRQAAQRAKLRVDELRGVVGVADLEYKALPIRTGGDQPVLIALARERGGVAVDTKFSRAIRSASAAEKAGMLSFTHAMW